MIKNLIKKIDELLFNGFIKRCYHKVIYSNDILRKTRLLNYTLKRKEKKSLLLADLIYRSPLDGVIVECGVGVGATLIKIAQISKKKIYAFDSFEGFPENLSENDDQTLSKYLKDNKWNYKLMNIDLVKQNLLNNKVNEKEIEKRIIFKKGFFPESFKGFDEKISFLHLDVDLYYSYKDCLEFFFPKILKNGIVTFDEYEPNTEVKNRKGWNFIGANKAIDEFVEKNNLKLIEHWTGFKYIIKE